MSLIFTRQVVGTTPSDTLTHCSQIPAVTNSSMYKTEMDLQVVRPHAQNAFRLAHMDSITAPPRENPPAACVISPANNAADAVESSTSAPSAGNHGDSEVKVETESVGKISDLITRFNGAEPGVLDTKIPAKKFRIDLQNVHTSYDTAGEDTNGSRLVQGDEVPFILGSKSTRLPVVQMKFKLHTETANPNDAIVDPNSSSRHKQLCVLKIPPKPAPKPVVTKNCSLQTAAICPPNTQPSEIHCIRPSDVRNVFPFASNECPRTDNKGAIRKTREYENGRNTCFQIGVLASQCNQNEHKLIQSQHRDNDGNIGMLPIGSSEEHTLYHKDERLPTDNPQEGAVTESLTLSMEEKLQKTTAMEEHLAVSIAKNQQKARLMEGSVAVPTEEKHTNAIAMRPRIVPSHVGINTHMQVDNNRKPVTKDVTPVSVVTLGIKDVAGNTLSKGSKITASDMASETSCCGSVAMVAEENGDLRKHIDDRDVQSQENGYVTVKHIDDRDVQSQENGYVTVKHIDDRDVRSQDNGYVTVKHIDDRDIRSQDNGYVTVKHIDDRDVKSQDNGYVTVKHEMEDIALTNDAEGMRKFGESKHGNMTETHRLVSGCGDLTTCADSSVGCCTACTDTTVGDTSMDASVVGCPTSSNSIVGCCITSTDSSVNGCTTSIDVSIDVSSTSTARSVDGYPTSTEPTVDGCKLSTDPKLSKQRTCSDPTLSEHPTSTDPTLSEHPTCSNPTLSGHPTSTDPTLRVTGHPHKDHSADGNTISAKLDMLKTELMAMRKMDLVLLRQLINISQAIQRIQRSDLPKMSRSLTILSSKKTLQPRFKPVERQNSAPHCADRRRFLFSNAKWRTEDDYRDSLSSFEESSFDSQSELEESSSSLNNTLNSPRSFDCPRILFQSCNIPLSLDISEEVDQNYEDILSRNVRLWKMSFQKHQCVQEKVDVWF